MVDCDLVIEKICRLPRDFRNGGKSLSQLAKDSGVIEQPDCITQSAIESYFRAHPDLLRDWSLYSQDQRSSTSWYIVESGNGWEVNHYPTEKGRLSSSDIFAAHAYFVCRQVESLLDKSGRQPDRKKTKFQPQ